ncbi:hypothetical protein DA120_00595 [Aeromonas sp. w55]
MKNAASASVISAPKPQKQERFEFRVTQDVRELFEQAASINGVSVSAFLKMAGRKVAEEIIESERNLRLTSDSYAKMVDLLSNPPEFNDRLTAAIESSRSGRITIENRKRKPRSAVQSVQR